MKKNFIPKSAFVGFILGALIVAVTFVFSRSFEWLNVIIFLAPVILLNSITDLTFLYLWVAVFCIIGGLIVPVVFSVICSCAGENVRIKAVKICNILVTACFTPYFIFALLSAVVFSCGPIMLSMIDDLSIRNFTVMLFTLAAVILLLPKPKFKISSEVGSTVLIVALILHVVFICIMISQICSFGYSAHIDFVCLLCYIVCVANLVIIRIFEQMPMHTLPRILLSLMCGVSCIYSAAFLANSAFNSSTDFTLITIPCGAVALIYFIYRAVKINRTKYVAEQGKT